MNYVSSDEVGIESDELSLDQARLFELEASLDGCLSRQTMTIPSRAQDLPAARKFICDLAYSCGFGDEEMFSIKVAVSEACTNAVEHGSPRGAENSVVVSAYCTGDAFVIEIMDEGSFRSQDPKIDGEISLRGRGILLMLSLMDKVTFDETNQGTRVVLTKHLSSRI